MRPWARSGLQCDWIQHAESAAWPGASSSLPCPIPQIQFHTQSCVLFFTSLPSDTGSHLPLLLPYQRGVMAQGTARLQACGPSLYKAEVHWTKLVRIAKIVQLILDFFFFFIKEYPLSWYLRSNLTSCSLYLLHRRLTV